VVWRWGDGDGGGRVLIWMGWVPILSTGRLEVFGVIAGAYRSRGKAILSLAVE